MGPAEPNSVGRARYYIALTFLITFIVLLCSCAGTKPAAKSEPGRDQPIDLTMPSGWTDSILEKVKNNQGLKSVIAVLDFEGNEQLQGKVDLKMSDMLITTLVKTGKFDVVERNKIDRVLKEQGLLFPALN